MKFFATKLDTSGIIKSAADLFNIKNKKVVCFFLSSKFEKDD